jgi:hypothetical protein
MGQGQHRLQVIKQLPGASLPGRPLFVLHIDLRHQGGSLGGPREELVGHADHVDAIEEQPAGFERRAHEHAGADRPGQPDPGIEDRIGVAL